MKLSKHETDLVGRWVIEGNRAIGDATEERINWLVQNQLEKISLVGSGF
jgi:hypothetical protein